MNLRITVIIPLLLVISSITATMLLYTNELKFADTSIRAAALANTKLDITRLQNILYNQFTESAENVEYARLNLSVTAMDSDIQSLLVADESDNVIVANRYLWENADAAKVSPYNLSLATKVRTSNHPVVFFSQDDSSVLFGYYPVILKLENELGVPAKRIGILFIEKSIAGKLAAAKNDSLMRSMVFGGMMLAISLLVAILLHFVISRRLVVLTSVSKAFAEGNLDARSALVGQDELARIGQAFDDMAERIEYDIQRREEAKVKLRELNETLEQRVKDRTALLQEAQRITRMGNWTLDIPSGKLLWSDEIYRIFGCEPGEIEPSYENFFTFVHPDDIAKIKESESKAFFKGERHSIDHRIVLPGGEIRWVHEEAVAKLDSGGKPLALAGTVQDITDRKNIEQSMMAAKNEAERASLAKSEFLARMSHELRTPLNAILGFAQILEYETLTEEQQSFVGEIKRAGDHLLALISELLDLGRIEAGRLAVVLSRVNIADAVDQALKIVGTQIESKQLAIDNNCAGGGYVLADSTRLRQVLVNLISNAAKFNRQGGSISITCKQEGDDSLRLNIHDTGPGINAEDLDQLFAPFERLKADEHGIEGTGIGLALSKQLMDLMGGTIGVDCSCLEGSTFWIELPQTSGLCEQAAESKSIARDVSPGRQTILYIEDNQANLEVVKAILKRRKNITLISAKNGYYGLELAEKYLPDIILLDIHLPDIDGFEVFAALQKNAKTRHIPVIALSADAMPLNIEKALNAGFREYLTKPILMDDLMAAINRCTTCRAGAVS